MIELLTVEQIWRRPCFICGISGPCQHRELEVAQAIIEGHQVKQVHLMTPKKPAAIAPAPRRKTA